MTHQMWWQDILSRRQKAEGCRIETDKQAERTSHGAYHRRRFCGRICEKTRPHRACCMEPEKKDFEKFKE